MGMIGLGNGLSVDPPGSDYEHHVDCAMYFDDGDQSDDPDWEEPECSCDDIYDSLAADAAEARRDARNSGEY